MLSFGAVSGPSIRKEVVTRERKLSPERKQGEPVYIRYFLPKSGAKVATIEPREQGSMLTITEFNIVVKGRLVTNFVIENGILPISNTLSLYQMTVFPQGATTSS